MYEAASIQAVGFSTMHPLSVNGLRACGIDESDVSQTWGTNVAASAGFHAPEGKIDNHNYSSCVDLRWHLTSKGPALKSRLVEAGFCPFYRDWSGNRHIHCVHVGLRDQHDKVRILAGPRTQIIDFTRGLNGLVGHDALTGPYAPTRDERDQIRKQYEAWVPHVAIKVFEDDGSWIPCYAFVEESGITRCEARPLLEKLGCSVAYSNGVLIVTKGGKKLDMSKSNARLEGGQFVRVDLRPAAEAAGHEVTFKGDHLVLKG